MRLRLLLLSLLILLATHVNATHIVGGEFEMRHIAGANYRLTLNLYFDVVNGDPGALDRFITVNFFDKGTNRLMMSQEMTIRSQELVKYTSIDCTSDKLVTRKIVYYEDIVLPSNVFNNQLGYYVVWERCCRNRTISNIVQPEDAAQAFYMEFPPVVKGGSPFINSSPVLFPPLSDYACVNELFYYDFSGTDPDRDSLVYDMVTPLNGYTDRFVPVITNQVPRPAPYPEIRWGNSYGRGNQINGSPPMSIEAQTGRLTVKPATTGLFVFGVRCQEYRNGVKIGEVRRDFQLLVLDCPRNESPVVKAQERGIGSSYKEGEVLRIDPNGTRCIDIQYTDPDPDEPLVLTARPVNFSNTTFTFSGTTSGTVNTGGGNNVLTASLCFPKCFDTEGKVYQIDLIARDNGCSLPRQDTLRVSFVIDPLPNNPPAISLTTPDRIFTVREGDVLNFDVIGTDADNEEVTLSAVGKDFDLATRKITFPNNRGIGRVTSPFNWQIDCEAMRQKVYLIEFQVTSIVCDKPVTRTELIEVRTEYPNQIPEISSDKQVLTFELDLNEPFEAKLFGKDLDPHQIDLLASGNGFTLEELGMSFTSTGGKGSAEGLFKWTANCDAFLKGDVRVTFALKETACVSSPDQTLTMEFKVKAPDLQAFLPANIFTPNGDGLNDFFEMPTLPETTCTGTFESIKIFNRWGKEVYSSNRNAFRWDGQGVNDGVYYYVIDYRSEKFRGAVTLVR
ncbi:gliding motility-associated C-terminal domain-containing protein [Pontibacter ruber]|uniref:Gliding motility-associated C-terminal domain-containing protein n=1 Tax=Pontibacter ruber TaxID=1343895 RepID=A0ABW5CS67_9BACT|nr:gliding motility-associated C-terminal domain-containing protein [Pontibacter ruber]